MSVDTGMLLFVLVLLAVLVASLHDRVGALERRLANHVHQHDHAVMSSAGHPAEPGGHTHGGHTHSVSRNG